MPDGSSKPLLFDALYKAKGFKQSKLKLGRAKSRKGQGKGRDGDGDGILNEGQKKGSPRKPGGQFVAPKDRITRYNADEAAPTRLNGVAFKPWADAPNTTEGWAAVAGQKRLAEPPMPVPKTGQKLGAGVIIREPDGRIWLAKPSNGFGGYDHTFPKGTMEPELSPQANAIKEAFEETGLKVEITGFAGDVERTTSVARYYFARRVGGTPTAHGWESEEVVLAPPARLHSLLNMPVDQKLAHAHAGAPTPPPPPAKPPSLQPLYPAKKPGQDAGQGGSKGGSGKPAGLFSHTGWKSPPAQGKTITGQPSAGYAAGLKKPTSGGTVPSPKGKGPSAADIFNGDWLKGFGFKKSAGRALLFGEVYVPAGTPVPFDAMLSLLEKAGKGGGKAKPKAGAVGAAGAPGAPGKPGTRYDAKAGQTIAGNLCRGPTGHFTACGVGGGGPAKVHAVKHEAWPTTNGAAQSAKKHIASYEALHAKGDLASLLAAKPNMDALLPGKGNPYTKGKAQAWQALHDDLTKSQAAKVVASAAAPTVKPKAWVKTGPQLGSNPGGQFMSPDGVASYVKFSKSEAHAKNEALASKLYDLTGSPAIPVKLIDTAPLGGSGLGTATTWEGKQKFNPGNPAHMAAAQEDFASHAWLANWDAVGTGMDNLAVVGGKMTVLDSGGALLFRAQGTPKGKDFGSSVVEWDTMRSTNTPGDAPKVFGSMDAPTLFKSAQKVAAIPDKSIRDVVMAHGPGTEAERYALAETMVQRKYDIVARANKLGMGDVTTSGVDLVPQPGKVSAPVPPAAVKVPAQDLTPKPAVTAPAAAAAAAAPGPGLDKAELQGLVGTAGKKYLDDDSGNSNWSQLLVAAKGGDAAAVKALTMKTPVGKAAQQNILGKLALKAKAAPKAAPAPAPAPAAAPATVAGPPKPVGVTVTAPAMASEALQAKLTAVTIGAKAGNLMVATSKVPAAAAKWQLDTLEQMGALPKGAKKLSDAKVKELLNEPDMKAALAKEPQGTTFYAQAELIGTPMAQGKLALVAYGLHGQATPAGKLFAAKVFNAMGGGKPGAAVARAVAPAAVPKSLGIKEVVEHYNSAKAVHKVASYGDDMSVADGMYFAAAKGQADVVAGAKPTTSQGKAFQAKLLTAMGAPPVVASGRAPGAAAAGKAGSLDDAELAAIEPSLAGTNPASSITGQLKAAALAGNLTAAQAVKVYGPNTQAVKDKVIAAMQAKTGVQPVTLAAPEASSVVKTPPALPAKLPTTALSSPTNAVGKKLATTNDQMHAIADDYAAGKLDADGALAQLTALEAGLPVVPNTYWKKVAKNHAAIKSSIASHVGVAQAAAAVPKGTPQVVQPPAALAPSAKPAGVPAKPPKAAPVFDPGKLTEPPDFLNWGGSGKGGPSSKQLVNEANAKATKAIFAAAKTGDPKAIDALTADVVDAQGNHSQVSVLAHPSQHVKGYAEQAKSEIELQLNPPKTWRASDAPEIAALSAKHPAIKVADITKVTRVGQYGVLGQLPAAEAQALGVGLADPGFKQTYKNKKLTTTKYDAQAKAGWAKMSATAKAAVKSHTGGGYHGTNQQLWSGNEDASVAAARSAIVTHGHYIEPGTILSRKISLAGKDLADLQASEGRVLFAAEQSSSSINPDIWSGNVHLKMTAGPGVKGLWVSSPSAPISSVGSGEMEMMLPSGMRLLVQKVHPSSNTKDADGFGGGGKVVIEVLLLPNDTL